MANRDGDGDGDGDECHQINCLMSRTIAVHVRFESWCISFPSFTKQQREMTNFEMTNFEEREPQWLIFCILLFELNAVGACVARATF